MLRDYPSRVTTRVAESFATPFRPSLCTTNNLRLYMQKELVVRKLELSVISKLLNYSIYVVIWQH